MTRQHCVYQLSLAIAAVRRHHPTRVAIDGVDGVGKTALANELVEPLAKTGRQIIRASVDGFHRPRADRYRRGADSPKGYFLDSFDYSLVRSELLDPLGPGGALTFRSAMFDHRTDQPVDAPIETASPDAILLLDGVFLQCDELADGWDFRIWVEAPFDVTVRRAVRRDAAGRNETAVEAKYRRRYVPGQVIYLAQCRPKEAANVIVHNADVDNPHLEFKPTV